MSVWDRAAVVVFVFSCVSSCPVFKRLAKSPHQRALIQFKELEGAIHLFQVDTGRATVSRVGKRSTPTS